jgi:hypothetical protein
MLESKRISTLESSYHIPQNLYSFQHVNFFCGLRSNKGSHTSSSPPPFKINNVSPKNIHRSYRPLDTCISSNKIKIINYPTYFLTYIGNLYKWGQSFVFGCNMHKCHPNQTLTVNNKTIPRTPSIYVTRRQRLRLYFLFGDPRFRPDVSRHWLPLSWSAVGATCRHRNRSVVASPHVYNTHHAELKYAGKCISMKLTILFKNNKEYHEFSLCSDLFLIFKFLR